MNTQEQAITCRNGQRGDIGRRKARLRTIAFIAIIGAFAVVTTTVVMLGGPAPAHACLLPGFPC
jgi:hypothetical protein